MCSQYIRYSQYKGSSEGGAQKVEKAGTVGRSDVEAPKNQI